MCKEFKRVIAPTSPISTGNHALQDYQMQLMLLEQGNKKRLMMARQEQDNMMGMLNNGSSSSSRYTGVNILDYSSRPTGFSTYTYSQYEPVEPAWNAPLTSNYFNMIRSFRVEIIFPSQPPYQSSISATIGFSEKMLHTFCDDLHKLVGRFRLMPRPLSRLEIVLGIKIGRPGPAGMSLEEAMSTAQVLLRSFQRLRNVGKPDIPLVLINDSQNREISLLSNPSWARAVSDRNFYDYLQSWVSDVSSSTPLLESPVFKAYWQLDRLLTGIRDNHPDGCFRQFPDLLHTAKVAREADDMASFRVVWDTVLNIWLDYVNNQTLFQSNVSLSIDAIDSTIRDDSDIKAPRQDLWAQGDGSGCGLGWAETYQNGGV
jgi:hypothetical protein